MGAIFISYRRNDSQGEAGRLFDDLAQRFGEDMVFMDVAGIEAGRDFRKAIEESVSKCGVLLVVMGPQWLDARDENGARRLDDPGDFVRIETASALRRDIPVIPVLVHGAEMPRSEQLPENVKGSVVLDANISKDGAVENLRAVSGHPLLIPAAIDAVKHWRYKPYVQNGQAVPINTQITVNFALTGG